VSELKPVYLVQGDDEVKIESWRARVRARAHGEGPSASLEVLSSDRLTAETFADAVGALTLAVGRRYVIAEGVERLKEKEAKQVAETLANLPPETIVVLIAVGRLAKGKGPVSESLVKAVKGAGGEVHPCPAPKAAAYPAWVAERGAELGLVVSGDAAAALVERIGPQQRRLMRELEKLACYAPEEGRVDRETVEALTITDVEAKAYELADALIEQDADRALRLAEDLRDRGADIMHVLFALLRQLRQSRRAWAMLEEGRSAQEIQSALRVPPFIARQVAAQAARADGERLAHAIDELAELDYAVRGGGNVDAATALTLTLARTAA
jgi:DNA polymerase III subunit delta